jgi:hypothetical protein
VDQAGLYGQPRRAVFGLLGRGGWFLCAADSVGPGWAGGGAVMLAFHGDSEVGGFR